jgi:predicted lipid-binding transport protein (Tim44 family)
MPVDPLTIIAALVALFVIWKLRSVLGERTGYEKPPTQPFVERPKDRSKPPGPPPDATRDLGLRALPGAAPPPPDPARWRPYAEPGTSLSAGFDAIAKADPAFSPQPFVEGAKIAYERILTAFAGGDRGVLQSLLAKDVLATFNAALDERSRLQQTLTTTFVSLDDARIESAGLDGRIAHVDVRFRSKQITCARDAAGTIVDGSPDRVADVDDIWTFTRDTSSRDPNWKLVATRHGS